MGFSFDQLYYSYDEHEMLHLYFYQVQTNRCLYASPTKLVWRDEIDTTNLVRCNLDILSGMSETDRVIKEVRQNEMFEFYFLLGDNSILKTFTTGDNCSKKGFIYTFNIYSPTEKYYRDELMEEYDDAIIELISISR